MQRDIAVVGRQPDSAGVDLGLAVQGLGDLRFDVLEMGRRLDDHVVCDTLHADEAPYELVRGLGLISPVDLAFERDPSMRDLGLDR
jgi:hypothetical protein